MPLCAAAVLLSATSAGMPPHTRTLSWLSVLLVHRLQSAQAATTRTSSEPPGASSATSAATLAGHCQCASLLLCQSPWLTTGVGRPRVNHGSIPAAPPPLLRVCASAGPGAGCAALSRAAAAVPPPCCPAGAPCCARAGCHQLPRQLRPLPAALPRAAPGVARPQRRPRRRHLLPQPLKKKFMTVFAAAKQHFMAAPAQQESRTCGAGSGR